MKAAVKSRSTLSKELHVDNIARTDFVFVVTTDGSRPKEFARLLDSVLRAKSAAFFILLQRGAVLPPDVSRVLPERTVVLSDPEIIPLSVARNRLLDAISLREEAFGIHSRTLVLLADDDCWYSDDFFHDFDMDGEVAVCAARDPANGKHFSTFDITRRRSKAPLAAWELMFYGVSISFVFRYSAVRGMRFKPNIGLGNKISQGEESLFVMRILEARRAIRVHARPEKVVLHPWKMASDANNHGSLGYFLGWASTRGHSSVLPYFVYLAAKYFAALIIKRQRLYFDIFTSVLTSFVRGVADTNKIGGPND